jgi:hypothetical protein
MFSVMMFVYNRWVRKNVLYELSLPKLLNLVLFGDTPLFYGMTKEWSKPMLIYVVNCKEHGRYLDYKRGRSEYFMCPFCLDEEIKRSGPLFLTIKEERHVQQLSD